MSFCQSLVWRESDLVCLLSVIAVREQRFVLALLLDASLLQVELPLGLKVEPLLLVLCSGTRQKNPFSTTRDTLCVLFLKRTLTFYSRPF